MLKYIKVVSGVHWAINIFVGILVTLAALAITLWFLIVFGSLLTPIPLHATVVESGVGETVCPGDRIVTYVELALTEPSNLEIIFTTTDANQEHIFLEALERPVYAVRARDAQYVQPFVWEVPALPPATYVQTMSLWPRGTGGDPVFLEIPFVIGSECLAKRSFG